MPFDFQPLEIPEVLLVRAATFPDERGFFKETYRSSEFRAQGIGDLVQDNFSHSIKGVLRGLHYQKNPASQGKLVQVVQGRIFDVGVDIRKGSPTYGKWVSAELSPESHTMMWIPPGFAHGFCVLSDEADVVYKVTHEFTPDLDRGMVWNDPTVGIPWPISNPLLSSKDQSLPTLQEADNDFVYRAGS